MENVKIPKSNQSFKILNINSSFSSPFSSYYPGCSEILFKIESKECSICLSTTSSIKARPNICDHIFCSFCLTIWSKQKKTCPFCRKKYSRIIYI